MRTDILKASILAVLAASLLGATTYFVSEQIAKEEHKPTFTLDAFTPEGGQGSTIMSSSYFSNESVSIYALVRDASNLPVTNTSVVFQIAGPPNSYHNVTFEKTMVTNASGIAAINITVPPEQDHPETVIGIWSVVATAQVESGKQIVDSFIFGIEQPPSPFIDIYTDRGGQGPNIPSQPYHSGENVTLYARISDGSNPVVGYLVAFSVFKFVENGITNTTILVRTGQTDASGIASIFFALHPEPAISVGRWQVLTKVMIRDQVCVDTLTFECARV